MATKKDFRAQHGRWAPGNYYNKCTMCGEMFIGDKYARQCADCAYGSRPPTLPREDEG